MGETKKRGRRSKEVIANKRFPRHSDVPVKTAFRHRPVIHFLLIIILGLIAYSNTIHSPLHFDDRSNIIENNGIRDISNIPSFFTRFEGPSIMARPLTAATFAVNYYFGGLDTTGYHIFNLGLHIANGILLYLLISITARYLDYSDEKKTGLIALFSSLIFMVHPIQTETVTYIVSRSVLLSTFFLLLGIVFFTKAVGSLGKKRTAYIIALFFASLLGMASREEFLIFPLILMLYDLYFISKRNIKTVLKNWKAHLPVAAALAYVAYIVSSYDYREHAGFGVKTVTPLEYLMTQFNVHWTYIRLLLLPINQNLDYDYPIAKALFEFPTMLSFIGYLGLWGAVIYLYRKNPTVSFCLLFFLITLAPSSGIIPIADFIFEHRVYVPSIGFGVAVSMLMFLSIGIFRNRHSQMFFLLFFCCAPFLLTTIAHERNAVWLSEKSLWGDVLRKSPNKARPYNNLGVFFTKNGQFSLAEDYFEKALEISVDYIDPYFNLGAAYEAMGEYEKAEKAFQNVLRINPNDAEAHNRLGVVYGNLKRYREAEERFQSCLRINPLFFDARNNLGVIYEKMEQYEKAESAYRKALKINPTDTTALSNLGVLFGNQGRYEDALRTFRKALSVNPNDRKVQNNLETINEWMLKGHDD